MENCLITWFYSEKSDDESYYPSVGGNTSSVNFQHVYWKCIYDFYSSAMITDRGSISKYIFFTNVTNLPVVDDINFSVFFKENNIEVVILELTRKTPKDWYGAWRNQFYLFDVLEYLKDKRGNYLILDSDCIIRKDLLKVFEDIKKEKNISYEIGYPIAHNINGITIQEMRKLYVEFYGESEQLDGLTYIGGEIIGISSSLIESVMNEFEVIWNKNYYRYKDNVFKLNEEAHFLSLIYFRLGYTKHSAQKYIKRMWTAIQCDNIDSNDGELYIWHLPAEKKYGFSNLFELIKKDNNLSEKKLQYYVERIMRIPGSSTIRKCYRIYNVIRDKYIMRK